MGLDITAYSNIKRADDQTREDDDAIRLWKHRDFPDHLGIDEGVYETTPETRTHKFGAGPYSAYNRFRNKLAQCTLGVTSDSVWEDELSYASKPFYNLINFSDCDGTIGPDMSADLYQDFVENRERFIRNLRQEIDFTKETDNPLSLEPEFILDLNLEESDIEYYIEQYDELTRAFELAKDNGIVDFH
jgi:hypothetical protein